MTNEERARELLRDIGSYEDDVRVAEVVAALQQARREGMEVSTNLEQKYRRLLWLSRSHIGLYGDDGEMQCNKFGPCDFKRDSLESLEALRKSTTGTYPCRPGREAMSAVKLPCYCWKTCEINRQHHESCPAYYQAKVDKDKVDAIAAAVQAERDSCLTVVSKHCYYGRRIDNQVTTKCNPCHIVDEIRNRQPKEAERGK